MTIVKVTGPIPKQLKHRRRVVNLNHTAAAKNRFEAIAGLDCVLALNWAPECKGRTTVAHQDGAGMALKAPPQCTFACCEGHHLFGPNSITEMGVKKWERKYGPQAHYIAVTNYRLGIGPMPEFTKED